MAVKPEAYVDSGAFIAFRDRSDTWHSFFASRFARAKCLVTSSLVIAETHAWFLRRFDANRALQFLAFIDKLDILIIYSVGQSELKEAQTIVKKFADQTITLTDAVGLQILKTQVRLENWSIDHNMELTGRKRIIHTIS